VVSRERDTTHARETRKTPHGAGTWKAKDKEVSGRRCLGITTAPRQRDRGEGEGLARFHQDTPKVDGTSLLQHWFHKVFVSLCAHGQSQSQHPPSKLGS